MGGGGQLKGEQTKNLTKWNFVFAISQLKTHSMESILIFILCSDFSLKKGLYAILWFSFRIILGPGFPLHDPYK